QHTAGHRNHLTHPVACDKKMIAGEVPQSRQGFFRSDGSRPKCKQLIQEMYGPLKRSILCADEWRLRPSIRPQSETLEDIQVANLVARKDQTFQHDPLPRGCFKRGIQIRQCDRRSAFRVSIVDMAERMRPDFVTDTGTANPLHYIRCVPGWGGI